MVVYQAFRFELDPNDVARSALASHAGAASFAYNWSGHSDRPSGRPPGAQGVGLAPGG